MLKLEGKLWKTLSNFVNASLASFKKQNYKTLVSQVWQNLVFAHLASIGDNFGKVYTAEVAERDHR